MSLALQARRFWNESYAEEIKSKMVRCYISKHENIEIIKTFNPSSTFIPKKSFLIDAESSQICFLARYLLILYFNKLLIMRLIGFICLSLLLQNSILSQKKARDFKVTTTDKKAIELYKDYLDKGRIVMLKIMFVDCPPCNDIAPQLSQLYKKYGSGNQKVEFIELSNKAWDADPAVIGYKIKYDLPCPSVSNDGGSVQASDLYSDNFYGPFFGTPTFIVIKPDGLLEYDVRGSDKNETIRLLDTSLARAVRSLIPPTPPDTIKKPPVDTIKPPVDTIKPPVDTIKPPVDTIKPIPIDTIKLQGKLIYNGGGLGAVTINLTIKDQKYSFKTDITGNFKFSIPDTFKNVSNALLKVDYNLNYNDDLTALDLLLIQKHILAIERFGDYRKLLAADANNDGDINVLDIVELRRLILGLSNSLPNNTPSVYFLFQNANNLIKSLINPINMDELRALKNKSIQIEVIKTGNVK